MARFCWFGELSGSLFAFGGESEGKTALFAGKGKLNGSWNTVLRAVGRARWTGAY